MQRGFLGARPRPQHLERSSSCRPVRKRAVRPCGRQTRSQAMQEANAQSGRAGGKRAVRPCGRQARSQAVREAEEAVVFPSFQVTFRTRGSEAMITLVASLTATWMCPLASHGMSPTSHARPSALFPGQASEWPPCGAPVPGSPSCCGGTEDMGLPCAAAGDGAPCYAETSKTPACPRGEALPSALHQEPRVSILPKPLLQKWRPMCPEAGT